MTGYEVHICDQCMELVHVEDCEEERIFNNYVCDLCQQDCERLYLLNLLHIRELMKKYKELLAQLDLKSLLDE